MTEKLEKDLSIDVSLRDSHEMLKIFELAKSMELPVVDEGKVLGLISIFDVCKHLGEEIDAQEMMETDIVVAGREESVFSFINSKQYILPFVNEEGLLEGFINRTMQKCYLPNEEYMRVMEHGLDEFFNKVRGKGEVDHQALKELKETFDVIFETNYDGLYITMGQGDTLSINVDAAYAQDTRLKNMKRDGDRVKAAFDIEEGSFSNVNLLQHVQRRKEFSLSEDVISDGGIIRIVDGLKNFEKIRRELEETQTLAEAYKNELDVMKAAAFNTKDLVAESAEMKSIIELALKVSNVDTTALIQGQSGVGKGVISKFIHENSSRSKGPFVKIDCGSIPEHLLESELFGYVKGAFTGAEKEGKIGQIELANHGTVFLDEIGELPLNLQTKLLQVLQDKQIKRVGATEMIDVDIRIIAATNRNLAEMVRIRTFREDLFYRLNVVPIMIPPLRNRIADIKVLIDRCMDKFNREYGMKKQIEKPALKRLLDYDWPGNVRELENVIEYLMVTTEEDMILERHLPESILSYNSGAAITLENAGSMKDAVNTLEKKLLTEAMGRCRSTEEMAVMLKVDRSTITRKLQKYGIKTSFKN
ncbi:MAG: sigma 54-interacting transcriptional regulator [Bacillota bacterium]|nr:sigma 54-interacting transcriptional regulator [Bacillota bacterium]